MGFVERVAGAGLGREVVTETPPVEVDTATFPRAVDTWTDRVPEVGDETKTDAAPAGTPGVYCGGCLETETPDDGDEDDSVRIVTPLPDAPTVTWCVPGQTDADVVVVATERPGVWPPCDRTVAPFHPLAVPTETPTAPLSVRLARTLTVDDWL